eukprot:scaffold87368_cov51-Phaeocystis_antarctica.AAC.2
MDGAQACWGGCAPGTGAHRPLTLTLTLTLTPTLALALALALALTLTLTRRPSATPPATRCFRSASVHRASEPGLAGGAASRNCIRPGHIPWFPSPHYSLLTTCSTSLLTTCYTSIRFRAPGLRDMGAEAALSMRPRRRVARVTFADGSACGSNP